MSYQDELLKERINKVWRRERALGSWFWVCLSCDHSIRIKVPGQLPPDTCPKCDQKLQSKRGEKPSQPSLFEGL
jgi:rubrerythrin